MIAILGAGIAGLTAAWQLHQLNQPFTLFEATNRLGGTVETIRQDGFVVETGPDGWVTEKPWATQLAIDLGLEDQIIHSNDATRVTYILSPHGHLTPIPDGMRMMVPTNLAALETSPLFSPEAIEAYAAEPHRAHELRATAPNSDESVSQFVQRHFGPEVLLKIGAPLLSGVFGGNVETLSVRAVMPTFVQMERDHGSLILALQSLARTQAPRPIFTSLRHGTQTLIDAMAATLPPQSILRNTPVTHLTRTPTHWLVNGQPFDHVFLALPAHIASPLLAPTSPRAAQLLTLAESSAILVAFAFSTSFPIPPGFGFLAPAGTSPLLAATFVDQKYPHRVPPGTRLLRAFYGGSAESPTDPRSDEDLATLALAELRRILPASHIPNPTLTLTRRWPRSLPQYAVGHLTRIAELDHLTPRELPALTLLGNPYRGVGLPDLIRDSRQAARQAT